MVLVTLVIVPMNLFEKNLIYVLEISQKNLSCEYSNFRERTLNEVTMPPNTVSFVAGLLLGFCKCWLHLATLYMLQVELLVKEKASYYYVSLFVDCLIFDGF